MTVENIGSLIADFIEEKKQQYGSSNELTPAQIDVVTDGVAAILDTVNPNHSYPQTNK
jgi:hypothetical protein